MSMAGCDSGLSYPTLRSMSEEVADTIVGDTFGESVSSLPTTSINQLTCIISQPRVICHTDQSGVVHFTDLQDLVFIFGV